MITKIPHKYGKDQRNTFVCEADTRSGEWIQTDRAHFLRQRCYAVLLKSKRLNSPKIAVKVDLCQQSINSKNIVKYLDALSFRVNKKTVAVLDKAKKVMYHRELWERRGFSSSFFLHTLLIST